MGIVHAAFDPELERGTSIDKLVRVIQDADVGCAVVPDKAELATLPLPALERIRD